MRFIGRLGIAAVVLGTSILGVREVVMQPVAEAGQAAPDLPKLPSPPDEPRAVVPATPPLPQRSVIQARQVQPLKTLPLGARAEYLNTKRLAIDYEMLRKGASGVKQVKLLAVGASRWEQIGSVNAGEPLEVELSADGVYGFKVVATNGFGHSELWPTRDTHPDLWVVLDTQRPELEMTIKPASSPDGKPSAPYVVEVIIKDTNIDPAQIKFDGNDESVPDRSTYTPLFTAADLSSGKVETKFGVFVLRQPRAWLDPDTLILTFDWTPPTNLSLLLQLGVRVKDRAGNGLGYGVTVCLEQPVPATRVTGVRKILNP